MASTRNLPHSFPLVFLASIAFLLNGSHLSAQEEKSPDKAVEQNAIDLNFKAYFAGETAKLAERCLNDLTTLDEWKTRRVELRRQLFEMLGLDPLPEKTDLKPVITKTVEGDGFKVECLHFQSSPGLYVTGNLYIPNEVNEKLPAILYVCGHGGVKKDGISYGNKVHYQHHGAWFARNGYVCLTIDSLQLGEIEGIHHGTYKYDMWWWINRGYTPAGVEAWNCIRALDYLVTRPEVDMKKIGVTGRSGGGAYSWWIAALDERIKVAVPVAGITDLQNHVVDGCVEGHCDCMYFNNTYRWDYPMVAALVAPRPLLISNTDRDRIFPLDGVYRTYKKVRKVYELYGKPEDVALHITAGPHKDTQELRIHAFRWFNHYLKGTDEPIRMTADKFFEPEQLRVFDELPADSINAKIHETFVPKAIAPEVPKSVEEWQTMRDSFLKSMRGKTFGGWPDKDCDLNLKLIRRATLSDYVFEEYQFNSQPGVTLNFLLTHPSTMPDDRIIDMTIGPPPIFERVPVYEGVPVGRIFDESGSFAKDFETALKRGRLALPSVGLSFSPRGYFHEVPTHNQRRYALLGQTLDGMRIYDSCRALEAVRKALDDEDIPVKINMKSELRSLALYVAMFDENVKHISFFAESEPEPDLVIPGIEEDDEDRERRELEHRKRNDPESVILLNLSRYHHPMIGFPAIAGRTAVTIRTDGGSIQENDSWKFAQAIDRLLDRRRFKIKSD